MTTAQELDERYGRTRNGRRNVWIIGGVLAALAIALVTWITVFNAQRSVDVDDLGYEVVDEHTVDIEFQITSTPDRDLVCAVQALDEEFGVVGWKVLEIPASDAHTQHLSTSIPTVAEATTGLVKSCWVA